MKYILQDGKLEEQKSKTPETKKEAVILTETTVDIAKYLQKRKQQPIKKLLSDLWELYWIRAVAKIVFLAILVWLLFFGLYGVVNLTTVSETSMQIADQRTVIIQDYRQEGTKNHITFVLEGENSIQSLKLDLVEGVNILAYGSMFHLCKVYPSDKSYPYALFEKKGKSLIHGLMDRIEVKLYIPRKA